MTNCDVYEEAPEEIFSAVVQDECGNRVFLISPHGDERFYDGNLHHTYMFHQALLKAVEGDTLKLLAGKYYRAAEAVKLNGSSEKPILIEGVLDSKGKKLTHICGTNAAGKIYPDLPDRNDYAFLKLIKSNHVVIKNLNVESCWPCFLYGEASSNVTLDSIDAQDSTYLAFFRGPNSQGVSVKNCKWEQDPTGALWSAIDWGNTHHGPYAYYNGGLIGGIDVEGNIEVSGNYVSNAYNAIRFTTSKDAEKDILGKYNVNANIHNNEFVNIRDNVVEPEKTLLNWHIHKNIIKNGHAVFSIHDFFGGYLYIYSNQLYFDDRGGSDYQENRGGKIYKLRHKGPLPKYPIHIFHNSLYSRTFLIKKAQTQNFTHRNNAVEFCKPVSHEKNCLCRSDREFLRDFPIDKKKKPLPWDPTVVFDGDASNVDFSQVLKEANQEGSGLFQEDLGLIAPCSGDFTLTQDSILRGAAIPIILASGTDLPPGQDGWASMTTAEHLNIGAIQEDGGLVDLPFQPVGIPFST